MTYLDREKTECFKSVWMREPRKANVDQERGIHVSTILTKLSLIDNDVHLKNLPLSQFLLGVFAISMSNSL